MRKWERMEDKKKMDGKEIESFLKRVTYKAITENINPLLLYKKAFDKLGMEYPESIRYFSHTSIKTLGKIHAGDVLVFDRFDIEELKDGAAYYFSCNWFGEDKYYLEDWGRYNKSTNMIETEILDFEVEEVTIWGKLFQWEREL